MVICSQFASSPQYLPVSLFKALFAVLESREIGEHFLDLGPEGFHCLKNIFRCYGFTFRKVRGEMQGLSHLPAIRAGLGGNAPILG